MVLTEKVVIGQEPEFICERIEKFLLYLAWSYTVRLAVIVSGTSGGTSSFLQTKLR